MTEQRLDAHYQGVSSNGTRIRVTAHGVEPPAKQQLEGAIWGQMVEPLQLVSVHTAWHRTDDEREDDEDDTDDCFPYDPRFDDELEDSGAAG